jgi:hypothetical protein
MMRHCDDIAEDPSSPACVRAYLSVARAPAHGYGMKCPPLFATLPVALTGRKWTGERDQKGEPIMDPVELPAGTRVRVVMASRFGDVGITPKLDAEHGYVLRVGLDQLSDFGDAPMSERFKVVDGSTSCHCCFEATVVDTTKPIVFGDKPYIRDGEPQFEAICECFDKADAERIAAAMNGKEAA